MPLQVSEEKALLQIWGKKVPSPLSIQGGGEEESPEVSASNPKSTKHPNSEVSATQNVCIKVAGRLK